MKTKLIILGSGNSLGVPRIDGNWGKCESKNKKNFRTRCSAIILIEFDPLKIIAEHRVLKFFLFLLSHFPQLPSILGTPREFPEPKIINFVFMLN
jgi:phosphoribosyl 1,2-cyclic phosphodiesterase